MVRTKSGDRRPMAPMAGYPAVAVRYAGRKIGLYRVQDISRRTLLLGHGGISFPVGTEIQIDDYQRLLPGDALGVLPAKVVHNDVHGIAVTW